MTPTNSRLGIGLAALVLAPVVFAGTDPYFNPLTQSSAVASPNHINELNSPWQVPAGMTQVNLFSMSSVEADADQSVQRARNAGNVASMFDMIAYDPSGNYLFIPHETPWGAGVSRFNIPAGINEVLFVGDQEASTDSTCGTVVTFARSEHKRYREGQRISQPFLVFEHYSSPSYLISAVFEQSINCWSTK
mgnify:CR=1 FL=1